jgi:hypothetical protein
VARNRRYLVFNGNFPKLSHPEHITPPTPFRRNHLALRRTPVALHKYKLLNHPRNLRNVSSLNHGTHPSHPSTTPLHRFLTHNHNAPGLRRNLKAPRKVSQFSIPNDTRPRSLQLFHHGLPTYPYPFKPQNPLRRRRAKRLRRLRHKVTGLQGIIICSPLNSPVRSYLPPEGYFA